MLSLSLLPSLGEVGSSLHGTVAGGGGERASSERSPSHRVFFKGTGKGGGTNSKKVAMLCVYCTCVFDQCARQTHYAFYNGGLVVLDEL